MAEEKEKNILGASYIASFFKNVSTLTGNYSTYVNLLIELKINLGGDGSIPELEDDSRNALISVGQSLRDSIIRTFIQYQAITAHTGERKNQEIFTLYKKIEDQTIIIKSDCYDFVVEMNNYLLGSIISSLLETSNNILNNIYGGADQ